MFSVARVHDGRGGGRGEKHGDDGGRRERDVGHGRGVLEKRLDEEETTTFTFESGTFGIGTVFVVGIIGVVAFFFFLAHERRIGMNRRRLYERPQWHVCDEEKDRERERREKEKEGERERERARERERERERPRERG